jgi:formiminotetrahydrofolate cyclodeaminase
VEQLAAPTPAPGGGSASAAAAAMAAGLAQMVASISRGKKNYEQYESRLSDAIARLDHLREELKVAIDADAESYKAVLAAYKYERTSPDGGVLVSTALQNATSVPLRVAEQAREVLDLVETLRPITNPSMASDLSVARALADAAITGALANVDINLKELKNEQFVAEVRKRAGAVKG